MEGFVDDGHEADVQAIDRALPGKMGCGGIQSRIEAIAKSWEMPIKQL
jgi:hypothetical protein